MRFLAFPLCFRSLMAASFLLAVASMVQAQEEAASNGDGKVKEAATNASPQDQVDYSSMVVAVKTNNGYTIHGIPTNPEMFKINFFGNNISLPWNTIVSVRFTDDSNATVTLEDGSKFNGIALMQDIVLAKEWGRVRIQRPKLESIDRVKNEQTRQKTPRSRRRANPARPPRTAATF